MLNLKALWNNLVRRFWWLRGATAALTLTALAPTFFDLSRYEFLRAFHAIVLFWNIFTSRIGQIIGQIPYAPELSGDAINTILFAASIGFPSFYSAVNPKFFTNGAASRNYFYFNTLMSIVSLLALLYMYYTLISDSVSGGSKIFSGILFVVLLIVMMAWALIHLQTFRGGMFFVVTFIVAMEILYVLKAPWLANEINGFACDALKLNPGDCLRKG